MLTRKALLGLVRWVLETFGSLGVFLLFEHTVSLTAAIIATTVLALALVAFQIRRDGKPSPFTIFIAISVTTFGALDLYFGATGFFVRIEPAIGNASTGGFFLWSALAGKPIIAEFARRQRGGVLTDRALRYCRQLTLVWAAFFFVRSGFWLYIGLTAETIDDAMAIRTVIGLPSFFALIGGEIVYRRLRHGRQAVMPVVAEQVLVDATVATVASGAPEAPTPDGA